MKYESVRVFPDFLDVRLLYLALGPGTKLGNLGKLGKLGKVGDREVRMILNIPFYE